MSRIEVGYGLEGALPDAKTGRIQDNSMIPFFRDGGYGIGIYSGFLAIVKEVYAEYGIEYEPAGYNYYNDGKYAESDSDAGGVLLFIFVLILVIIDLVFFKGRLTRFLIISSGSRHYRSHSGGFYSGGRSSRGGGFSGGGGRSGGGGSSRKW
ncbi:MAG: hypothetical protein GXZ01_03520 [Clostridiaceae bacterium]|nr:hypothetical protein [Clostridiaceae bacterium]